MSTTTADHTQMSSTADDSTGAAGWSWREWFALTTLVLLGVLETATESAWGLVVLLPSLLVLALGLACELAPLRRR